jgi:hypothetical protein
MGMAAAKEIGVVRPGLDLVVGAAVIVLHQTGLALVDFLVNFLGQLLNLLGNRR